MKKYIIYVMTVVFALSAMFIACKKDKDDKGSNDVPVTGVILNGTSVTLAPTGTVTLIAAVQPDNATNKTVTWSSSDSSVATVNNGLVTAIAEGTAVITVTTDDGDINASCTLTVTQEEGVVINGVRWATCNVSLPGTFAAKPEDAGMFYQWNRKVGWSSTDPMINSNGGATWDGSYPPPPYPIEDTWEKANDPSPVGWHVPTKEELESLTDTDYVAREWTDMNGIYGYRFTDKATGVSLFLPAAGIRDSNDGWLYGVGLCGSYWGTPGATLIACDLFFGSNYFGMGYDYSAYGYSVRCVAE